MNLGTSKGILFRKKMREPSARRLVYNGKVIRPSDAGYKLIVPPRFTINAPSPPCPKLAIMPFVLANRDRYLVGKMTLKASHGHLNEVGSKPSVHCPWDRHTPRPMWYLPLAPQLLLHGKEQSSCAILRTHQRAALRPRLLDVSPGSLMSWPETTPNGWSCATPGLGLSRGTTARRLVRGN